MISEFLLHVICPFMGTLGYAVLYNIPARFYLSCGITGTFGWLTYLLFVDVTSPAIASFFGALVVTLMARFLTVKLRCPIIIFLISAIFPLVPGAGIYNTVYHMVLNDYSQALYYGMTALKVAFAIAMGIAFILPIPRAVFFRIWNKKSKR